MIFINFIALGK